MWLDELTNWQESKEFVKEYGIESWVEKFEHKYDRSFFSCSEAWLNDPKYICKMKGARGDLIIGWKGVHG